MKKKSPQTKKADIRLVGYIEGAILPFYEKNLGSGRAEHVKYVIRRSLDFAKQINANLDMAYAVAAYHDVGLVNGRGDHEITGARMLLNDKNIEKFFTPEQMKTMAEAIQDHRASSKKEPRGIYGKIVANADRHTDINDSLGIIYRYRKQRFPELTFDEIFEMAWKHICDLYGKNGNALRKTCFHDLEYEKFSAGMFEFTCDKQKFRKQFELVNGQLSFSFSKAK